jgi:hypothetical protein
VCFFIGRVLTGLARDIRLGLCSPKRRSLPLGRVGSLSEGWHWRSLRWWDGGCSVLCGLNGRWGNPPIMCPGISA